MFVFSTAASAAVLPPGSGGSLPDIFPACPGCTAIEAITGGPTTTSFNGVVLTVDIATVVYSDPSNPFGAGKLDFIYQFTNESSSTASISHVTARNFAGFMTDVGYTAMGATFGNFGDFFVNGSVAPRLVDRNTASTVGFEFAVPPGEAPNALIIQTDATQFTFGEMKMFFDDGGAMTIGAFGPAVTPAVPEPATLSLFALGLVGFAIRRKASPLC
jgi:hypothetical protein